MKWSRPWLPGPRGPDRCQPARQSRGQTEASATAAAGPTRSGNVVRFDASSPQLERIRVAPVTAAMLPVDEFEVPGKVEPMPTRLAKVALPALRPRPRRSWSRSAITSAAGRRLLTVETPESSTLQSALRQAQADVTHRQAAVAKAEADLSRARDLLANRAIAQKDVITAETALAEATAALEQARATEDDVTRRLQLLGVDVAEAGWTGDASARRWTARWWRSPSPLASIAATPRRRS